MAAVRCFNRRVPTAATQKPGVDAARQRARRTKIGVAVASVAVFAVAVPVVRANEHGHVRPTHPLTPPDAFVAAIAQSGFSSGQLAPSQNAPVVQSGGS